MKRWEPLKEFEELQNRLRSLFFKSGNGEKGELAEPDGLLADWTPAVNVTEDEKEYAITADLPEVKKEDIKVTAEDGRLTIHGERKREEEKKNKTWHRIERSYGKYFRSFQLPTDVDDKKIDATFKDGVLTLRLPKCPQVKKKQKESQIVVK